MGEARRVSHSKTAAHAIVVAAVLFAGCGSRKSGSACEWIAPASTTSLLDDIKRAEDVAIRHADGKGYREGWRDTRESCEATLLAAIATARRLTLADISVARRQLETRRFDWLVYVPMFLVGVLAAAATTRGLGRRFRGEWFAFAVAIVVASVGVAIAITAVGQVWAGVIEVIRIGNGHLSYRASRIPWAGHRPMTFVAMLAVMWASALWHWHHSRHRGTSP